MTTVAIGGLMGLIMALIFIGHMAYAIVFRMPDAIERHYEQNEESTLHRMVLVGSVGAVVIWALLGVALALLSIVLADWVGTGFEPVPSIPYLIGVLMIAVGSAPVVLTVLKRIRLHILIEYALFVGIYGLIIPWLANSQ